MRKWRPTYKCVYVIPEVYGDMDSLEVILNRILPLRIFKNQEDILVFLGDYVDVGDFSSSVLDCLINIKKEYGDRVILLKGDHEEMMFRAVMGSEKDFDYWADSGGVATIASYLKKNNLNSDPYIIKQNRLKDLIPKEHLEFLQNLEYMYRFEDYMFFHGGFNPEKSILEANKYSSPFEYTSSRYLKKCLKDKIEPSFKDDFIYIGNHNYMGKVPILHKKYFLLGGAAPKRLTVFELNSMTACAVSKGKSRIYKYNFKFFE